jgi:sugar phosphate isomerase/epimerase
MAPIGLTDLIPEVRGQKKNYNTRNANDLDAPTVNTDTYASSFFPDTKKNWNQLPEEVKNIPSLEEFRHRTKIAYENPPKRFYQCTRKDQILMTCLRVSNPDLNDNLHERNLKDTSMCVCVS